MADFETFRVSAPAKLILFGEHAVVYGKSALAGSLNLRTSATVQPLSSTPANVGSNRNLIHLWRPDLKDEVYWNLEDITKLYNQGFSSEERSPLTPTSCPHDLQQILFSFCGDGRDKGAVACLYLYLAILGHQRLPLSLKFESEVPVGAGLGSSAAYSVSLAGALLALNPKSRELLRPSPTAEGLELVNRWALEAERIMHGDGASGIDNTVSTYGGALLYTKGSAPIQLRRMPALHTLIVNTRVSRDTKALVEGVRQRRTRIPNVMDPCMDSIHHISLEAKRLLEEVDDADILEKDLERLIEMNNNLLCCIGVGHPALDKVVRVTGKLGIKTKLTGAGGGGCAFSLIPNSKERLGSEPSSLLVDQAIEKLKQNGYQCLPSLLGGPGLTFHTL